MHRKGDIPHSSFFTSFCVLKNVTASCIMWTTPRECVTLPWGKLHGGEILTRTIKKIMLSFFALLLTLAAVMSMATIGASAAGEKWKYDFPSGSATVSITLDGERVLSGEAAIINSVTYVPLRSFAELLGADSISWNAKTATATVVMGSTKIYVRDGGYFVEAAGRYFYSPEKILNISNRLFVPIRPFASAFSLKLNWNGSTRTVELTRTGKVLESGASFYDSSDVYWLARIISAESGGESLKGQIAVGNVVLNRVDSKQYPNTIYGVIFDKKGGTQFSPVSMGTIYNTPTQSSIIAAKICLEGYSISDDILFFMNPRIATSNWISNNRSFAFTIGNHDFYY